MKESWILEARWQLGERGEIVSPLMSPKCEFPLNIYSRQPKKKSYLQTSTLLSRLSLSFMEKKEVLAQLALSPASTGDKAGVLIK